MTDVDGCSHRYVGSALDCSPRQLQEGRREQPSGNLCSAGHSLFYDIAEQEKRCVGVRVLKSGVRRLLKEQGALSHGRRFPR